MRLLLLGCIALVCAHVKAQPGDELAFNYEVTNIEVRAIDGQRTLVVSCADEAVGRYGMVVGTLTLYDFEPGSSGGAAVWRAVAFGGDSIVTDTSPGAWKMDGSTRIRIRNVSSVSDGTSLSGDGTLDLEQSKFQGVAVEIE